MKLPLISVVMPVYNGGQHLIDAVASIVAQTFQNWELICVNDGSTDDSGRILNWIAEMDSRIRVVHQSNAGIVAALNAGCEISQASLVMRMDNDDIALPDRMALQLEYMNRNPDCVVCGGAILEMDSESAPLGQTRLATSHEQIVKDLLHRRTGHFHPTTLIRRDALQSEGGYRSNYEWVEDHDLWLRLSRRGRLANLSDVVLCYRQHAQSICWQRSSQQRILMNELLTEAYRMRGLEIPPHVILDHATERSAAGPGKWARAAAKGGFPRTALKHLGEMNRGEYPWSYKVRMTGETLLRLGTSTVKSMFREANSTRVPSFEQWHDAWSAYNEPRSSHKKLVLQEKVISAPPQRVA